MAVESPDLPNEAGKAFGEQFKVKSRKERASKEAGEGGE